MEAKKNPLGELKKKSPLWLEEASEGSFWALARAGPTLSDLGERLLATSQFWEVGLGTKL